MMQHTFTQVSRWSPSGAQVGATGRVQRGFTIVELMIAMLLGIVLVGGTISLYLGNQESFRATQSLGKIQENGRLAFELLGREIRDAGANPCGVKAISNVIRTGGAGSAAPWWADWNQGSLVGVGGAQAFASVRFGTASAERVRNTDAIMVIRAEMDENNLNTIRNHAGTQITLDKEGSLVPNDPVLACDFTSGAIFQATAVNAGGNTIDHAQSGWNCTNQLGYPLPSTCANTSTKTFAAGGFVTKLDSAFWYIGISPRGTRSLYRKPLSRTMLTGGVPQEMVPEVQDMQITYLTLDTATPTTTPPTTPTLAATWVDAADAKFSAANGGWRQIADGATAANLSQVVAVNVTLTLRSPDTVNGTNLQRQTFAVFTVRNRERPTVVN